MDKEHHSQKTKPTLEELLRLKRVASTDAAFWERFDKTLREKQLAALVQPTRTSRLKPRAAALIAFFRWSIPTAAIAAIALGVFLNVSPEKTPPAPSPLAASQAVLPAPTASFASTPIVQDSIQLDIALSHAVPAQPPITALPEQTVETLPEQNLAALAPSVFLAEPAPEITAPVATATVTQTPEQTDSWSQGSRLRRAALTEITPEKFSTSVAPRSSLAASEDFGILDRSLDAISARWDLSASQVSIKF